MNQDDFSTYKKNLLREWEPERAAGYVKTLLAHCSIQQLHELMNSKEVEKQLTSLNKTSLLNDIKQQVYSKEKALTGIMYLLKSTENKSTIDVLLKRCQAPNDFQKEDLKRIFSDKSVQENLNNHKMKIPEKLQALTKTSSSFKTFGEGVSFDFSKIPPSKGLQM